MFDREDTTGTGPTSDGNTSESTSEAFGGDNFEEFAAAMNSEPTAEETTTEEEAAPVTEQTEETESTDKTDDAAEEETKEEDDSTWLPDEQEKEFPVDVLAKYAKRYGFTPEEAKSDPRIQRIIKDKINSDIVIRDREAADAEEEPTQDDAEEATDTDTTTAQPDQAKQREEYNTRVAKLVETTFQPEAVSAIGEGIVKAVVEGVFGINEKAMQDPNLSDEEKANYKNIIDNTKAVVKTLGPQLATGMADAVITVLPHILEDAIERIYPGTRLRHDTEIVKGAWNSVRQEKDEAGQPLYKDLPEYGAPDGAFGKLVQKVEKDMGLSEGGFGKMVLRDEKGNALSSHDQIVAKYRMIAKFANGQRVSPADAVKLIDKGKQQAADATRRRQAGRALGAGKPTQQFESGKGDAVMDNLSALIDQEEANKPFGK